LLSNPGEHFKAVHPRKFEVQQDQRRQRIFVAARIFSFSAEISDGLFAIANNFDWIRKRGFVKSFPHQEDVILSIFDN
jgi:hypothetical protein